MKKVIKKTFKYRLKPNKKQETLFAQYAGARRYIYNYFLEDIKKALDEERTISSYGDQSKLMTMLKAREGKAWLKDIHSQVLQQSLIDLRTSLKVFFQERGKKNGRGFPRFKRKGKNDSFRFPQYVKCENGKIRLPRIGWVSYRDSRPIEGKIKQATVKRRGAHWYVCIVCEVEIEIEPVRAREEDALGIDVGIANYAALSDGTKVPNPAYYKKLLGTLSSLYRVLSRKKKYSRNWYKWVKKIQHLHERIANLRNDFLHKLSTKIAKNHGVVCVEDLNIEGMMKNHKLARAIADAGWGIFLQYLKYKCDWYGKYFVKINRYFPSSKLCSSCGTKKDMPLHVRVFSCESCELVLDRDVNASINIRSAGLSDLKTRGELDVGRLSETGIADF